MITGPLCRAARALAILPRKHVARNARIDEAALADFEAGRGDPGAAAKDRIRLALEEGGALFIEPSADGGVGVRLKFNPKDVRAIDRLEDEGGAIGYDDI